MDLFSSYGGKLSGAGFACEPFFDCFVAGAFRMLFVNVSAVTRSVLVAFGTLDALETLIVSSHDG